MIQEDGGCDCEGLNLITSAKKRTSRPAKCSSAGSKKIRKKNRKVAEVTSSDEGVAEEMEMELENQSQDQFPQEPDNPKYSLLLDVLQSMATPLGMGKVTLTPTKDEDLEKMTTKTIIDKNLDAMLSVKWISFCLF